MKYRRLVCFIFTALFLISACTLQKRAYRKGYYLHLKNNSSAAAKISNGKEDKNSFISADKDPTESLIASNDKNFIVPAKANNKDSIKTITCGDSMWTREGNVSKVKIIEVTEYEVKYKRCANLNGQVISVPKSGVSKIKYEDGRVELIELNQKKESKEIKDIRKAKEKGGPSYRLAILCLLWFFLFLFFSVLSFLLVKTGFFIFGVLFFYIALGFAALTIICAFRALHFIKKKPEIYKGRFMALIALIITIGILFITALAAAIFSLLPFFA